MFSFTEDFCIAKIRLLQHFKPEMLLAITQCKSAGRLVLLTAITFNQPGQCANSPGNRAYCCAELTVFFSSSGPNHRQCSLCMAMEGWPG